MIRALICDAGDRLGRGDGVEAFKSYKFFEGIDWDNLYSTQPLWKPDITGPTDLSHFEVEELEEELSLSNISMVTREDDPSSLRRTCSLSYYLTEDATDTDFAGISYRRLSYSGNRKLLPELCLRKSISASTLSETMSYCSSNSPASPSITQEGGRNPYAKSGLDLEPCRWDYHQLIST